MTNLRTTALIEKKHFAIIESACRKRKIKQSKLIHTALRSMVNYRISENRLKTFTNVKYQNRGKKYIVIHFSIDPELYETCIELRKTNKMSVSMMLNEWFEKYLLQPKENQFWYSTFIFKVDNYPVFYQIQSEFIEKTRTLHTRTTIKLE